MNYTPGTPNNQTSFFNRLYYWTYGVYQNISVPNYQNSWKLINNSTALSSSLLYLQSLNPQQLLLINGGRIPANAGISLQAAFAPYI